MFRPKHETPSSADYGLMRAKLAVEYSQEQILLIIGKKTDGLTRREMIINYINFVNNRVGD